MERDALGQLSRAELLELIRRQQEALAERDEKIRELEEELAQFRRPVKTPENSSVPPSQARKPKRAERRGKQRGPKRGHPGVTRPRAVPDAIITCWPTSCGGCGLLLPPAG
jgi:transposase